MTGWAGKHDRQHKRRKGCGSQRLPAKGTKRPFKRRKGWNFQYLLAEGTEGPFHQKYTVLGALSSTVREEGMTRTYSGQNTTITATTIKKDSDQVSSKPVAEVPVPSTRCCWALISSLGEGVRRRSVSVSDTGSQREGVQQTSLFNNGVEGRLPNPLSTSIQAF